MRKIRHAIFAPRMATFSPICWSIWRTTALAGSVLVFAFRLIARNTVEEKVVELPATKRRLADAIVRAAESLIRDLRREDLELLLS